MFWSIVFFVAGCFVGWHVPQPSWAKKVQDWIYNKVLDIVDKLTTNGYK